MRHGSNKEYDDLGMEDGDGKSEGYLGPKWKRRLLWFRLLHEDARSEYPWTPVGTLLWASRNPQYFQQGPEIQPDNAPRS